MAGIVRQTPFVAMKFGAQPLHHQIQVGGLLISELLVLLEHRTI